MGKNFVQQKFSAYCCSLCSVYQRFSQKKLNKAENSAHATPIHGVKLVLFPDPTLKEGRGSGDIGEFSWSCAPSPAPIQIYVNSLMTAKLVEPRIDENVTRYFPRVCGWVWERDYHKSTFPCCMLKGRGYITQSNC